MNRPRLLLLVVLSLACTGFAWLVDAKKQGEESMIQKRYAAAVTQLETALGSTPVEQQDRVLLLLGRARWLALDHAGAVATYQRLIKEFPESTRVAKARLQQAEALADGKKFAAAAAIYREEIARLTGPERKEEVAATYLGLAEKALQGEKPAYKRAVIFFDLALDIGLSDRRSRSVRLAAAEAQLKAGDRRRAIVRFEALQKVLSREEGKLRAMLGLGRAYSETGKGARARMVLRDLLRLWPEAAEAAEAAWQIAKSYSVPTPTPSQFPHAVAALQELKKKYPAHEQAQLARFLIARCELHVGRTEDALVSLRAYIANAMLAESLVIPELAEARVMMGDALRHQGELALAIATWREYLSEHPSHKAWERVQRSIVDAQWQQATLAWQKGLEGYAEARRRLGEFAAQYPLDARNRQLLFLFGEMARKEDKFDAARAAYARCVSKYPGSAEASHAQFRVGEIFEQKTFNYQKALQAYKLVTYGPWAKPARQRLTQLEKKSLRMVTKRSYRTGENANFELRTRNIASVRVRVYRLDLETWFRATHLAGAVEKLDIEVIAPDRTFDSAITGYKPYRETTREVMIGFDEPGAYVVKVDDKELESTTMVLVTDLALIAKTSRHEFFLLTQDLKHDRVAGGVKVVLSDGQKIVAEGVTGADGVWRWRGKELRDRAELRAFVVGPSGSGASTLSLSGLGYSQGQKVKGYLFTDRPVYQPGQMVHMKGLLREVENGVYRLPKADDYRLQVSAPSGQILMRRRLSLSDFGTFDQDLSLPSEATLGEWRLRVDRPSDATVVFTANFKVAHYELPRMTLTAELKAPLVYRGEKIRGEFQLRYYFGDPAVGKAVAYVLHLPEGGRLAGKGLSNAAGTVPFEFATTEFSEEAVAYITATVAEENASVQIAVPIVTTEFVPVVKTMRDVYLAGESFDVDVGIVDRSGKALARSGSVVLLRRESKSGGVAEIEVMRAAFHTDAESGAARVSVHAEKGGKYLVRVESEDRFGHAVSASRALEISGEDDEVVLRLLTDAQHYKVGDRIAIQVVNRAKPRLVLQTLQGDGILAYETKRLPTGRSVIEMTLEAQHAPNFGLALAMIDGLELRTALQTFAVDRGLKLEIKAKRASLKPGEEVEVELRAVDSEGHPVAAEVAISLVDESVYGLHADSTPAIGRFFYGHRREVDFRTQSSCSWRYEGITQSVSQELLAEERRLSEEIRSAASLEGDGADMDKFVKMDYAAESTRRGVLTVQSPQDGGEDRKIFDSRKAYAKRLQTQTSTNKAFDLSVLYTESGRALAPSAGSAGSTISIARGFDRNNSNGGFELLERAGESADPRRTQFSESGGWIASVRTGVNGKAVFKLTMPHSTTAWRITGRAITRDTSVGQARCDLVTAKTIQVALRSPTILTEGDRIVIGAQIHNRGDELLTGQLSLSQDVGGKKTVVRDAVEVAAYREHGVGFEIVAQSGLPIRLDLGLENVRRGGQKVVGDGLVRELKVKPFGVEKRVGRSGLLTEQAQFTLALPAGRDYSSVGMRVEVGPQQGRDLVAAVLADLRSKRGGVYHVSNAATASRGAAAIAVLGYLERSGRALKVDRERLDAIVRAVLHQVLVVQKGDGSFAWVDKVNADLETTSRIARFLARARHRDLPSASEALDKAVDWLKKSSSRGSREQRVAVAWALALAGRARFETLNSLHRQRAGMTVGQLGRLALAWIAAGRKEMASELLTVLRGKLVLPAKPVAAQVEDLAICAQALLRVDRLSADASRILIWLQAERRQSAWITPMATAAALAAFEVAGVDEAAAVQTAEIEIVVNGKQLAVIPPAANGAVSGFDVPVRWLRDGGNSVSIRVRGRAALRYDASLTGFARKFDEADRDQETVATSRKYLAATRHFDGKPVPEGFGVVSGKFSRFENLITQLAVGSRGRVETHFKVLRQSDRETLSPLVVEEPLPAGCTVPRDSIHGAYDSMSIEPDRIVFFYRRGVTEDTIHYTLQARFEGSFRALPTRIYGAMRPDRIAYGPVSPMHVLGRGEVSSDIYVQTPDALYDVALHCYAKGDLKRTGDLLDRLLKSWVLEDPVMKEAARMMLFVSIDRGDSAAVVRFFETLKERYENLVIPFEQILAVGQAYIDIGEFESAVMVFRATAESSFLKEAAIAAVLEEKGELRSSMQFLKRLLDDYPDLNTMRVSLYSIAHKLAAIAAEMDANHQVDPRVGSRGDLRRAALSAFREFLIWYPEDPLAEEVSFAWATTLVEGRRLEDAVRIALDALKRYPGSSLEDELLYTAGYANFVLGHPDAAFGYLRDVAEKDFSSPKGGRHASENRKHAIYLQGQIHHSLGRPTEALALYDQVLKDFSDAGEAADYFRRQGLEFPEVSSFDLEEDVALAIKYRNLKALDIKVYRVDLMRLYILHKSLNQIRNIVLHGIKPYVQERVVLGDGKNYCDEVKNLTLALKDPGAYLVVIRGGDMVASGMVLRTGLTIEVQESLGQGRLRVNVKRAGRFLGDAHVKVVGSGDGVIRGGDTDLRGLFVANALVGKATVIVRNGDEFGFYRGEGVHQPRRYRPVLTKPSKNGVRKGQRKAGSAKRSFNAWENNLQFNRSNRGRQLRWLKDKVLNAKQQGVEVYRTK